MKSHRICRKALASAATVVVFLHFAGIAQAQTITTLTSFKGSNGDYP